MQSEGKSDDITLSRYHGIYFLCVKIMYIVEFLLGYNNNEKSGMRHRLRYTFKAKGFLINFTSRTMKLYTYVNKLKKNEYITLLKSIFRNYCPYQVC